MLQDLFGVALALREVAEEVVLDGIAVLAALGDTKDDARLDKKAGEKVVHLGTR
ncbi:hypothetical protein SERLA73DRAFT_137848 [Serpula lacrymans var. lacrymans S7.3]|uniref:Uncharacterized protein n=2 Tax=Serpula lacrymans var. lacrymans TaxID=341189 RepID=F8PXH9_SERL3|nr:uncharacterized protein SERLADRAFT_391177 [Serpula lacrymans var. lacrymans S7.9]EGN99505.1 hypothetical protein SERLA73DRAFT_137848 [Serpula lacrymans var. lacrymans S7.3]EGO25059.1 hypothetical protein SERLADRAFT_391177 [Serpula lacrymans var. lacrymans S7.9]